MSAASWLRLALVPVIASAGLHVMAAAPAPDVDWSGTWHAKGSVALLSDDHARMFVPGTRDRPPFRPEYEREYTRDLVRAENQGNPKATDVLTDTNTLHCFAGMPRVIAAPFPYNFLVMPKETWIIIDKAVRRVFTDGRDWPAADARWPLMLGRSKGTWEGDTLVIETVDLRSDMWADTTPLMFSEKASIIERIRKTDPNTLEDRVTIRDPVKFTQDWQFVRQYARFDPHEWPDDPELCGGPDDRNPVIDGHVTVTLPGDPKK
jgi:hypothetical protein